MVLKFPLGTYRHIIFKQVRYVCIADNVSFPKNVVAILLSPIVLLLFTKILNFHT